MQNPCQDFQRKSPSFQPWVLLCHVMFDIHSLTEKRSVPTITSMKIILPLLKFATVGSLLAGCAVLHHVQLSDIDNRSQYAAIPFDVKVSENGFNVGEAVGIAQAMSRNANDRQNLGDLGAIIETFQMGPRTGSPVYTDRYAEKLIYQLHTQCPSGMLTGVQSIRESREYPVIKGEIIKVTGYCLRPKGS